MSLYHKEVYFPNGAIEECPKLYNGHIRFGQHVQDRIITTSHGYSVSVDRLNKVIQNIQSNKPSPFEIEIDDKTNQVVKCVIRESYDERRDICLVFRQNFLVTVWFNDKEDKHKTLNKSLYTPKPKSS